MLGPGNVDVKPVDCSFAHVSTILSTFGRFLKHQQDDDGDAGGDDDGDGGDDRPV